MVYCVVKEKIIQLCPETEERAEDNKEATEEKQDTAMEFLLAETDTPSDQWEEELERYLR